MYAKISILILVGGIIIEHLIHIWFMYQYGNLGKYTQVRIPWTTLTFFTDFMYSPHDIGTLDRAQTP